MSDGSMFLTVFSIILQVFSLSIGIYYLIVGITGFLPIKDKNKEISDKTHKFALIISAHNEEVVIGNMVESLKQLDYPDDAYDIFVIADNCDDNTAKAAEDAGALVYVRNVPELRGKGHALEWMFDKLYKMDEQYDYISVFDADNLVDKNYLKAMNERANQGFKVVQGFLDSKNPYDSWITAAYSFCFWSVNRIFQLSYIFGNSWLWNVIVILQFCYTPFVIWYERREFKPKMVFYYFTYILYNFTWVPIAIQGMIGKNKTEWSHTKHTRTISMEELNRLNSK